jgi:hypothetical protein
MMAVAKYDTIKAIWDYVNMMGNWGSFERAYIGIKKVSNF